MKAQKFGGKWSVIYILRQLSFNFTNKDWQKSYLRSIHMCKYTFLDENLYYWVYLVAKFAQFLQNNSNSSWDGLESKSKFLGFHNWLNQTRPLESPFCHHSHLVWMVMLMVKSRQIFCILVAMYAKNLWLTL